MPDLSMTTTNTPPIVDTHPDLGAVAPWPKAPLQVALLGGRGAGKTKKAAEQEAASLALDRVEDEWPPDPGAHS